MVKKKIKSNIIKWKWNEVAIGNGSPSLRVLTACMILFIAIKSCNNLLLPDFFFMTRIRVFQRLLDDPLFPTYNCFSTKAALAASSSPRSSHWSTQTNFSDNQVIKKSNYPESCLLALTMATDKKISHGISQPLPFIITLICGTIVTCWVLPKLLMGYIPYVASDERQYGSSYIKEFPFVSKYLGSINIKAYWVRHMAQRHLNDLRHPTS